MDGRLFPQRIRQDSRVFHLSHRRVFKCRPVYPGSSHVHRRLSGFHRRRYQDKHLFRPDPVRKEPHDKEAVRRLPADNPGRGDLKGIPHRLPLPACRMRRNLPSVHFGAAHRLPPADIRGNVGLRHRRAFHRNYTGTL